LYNGEFFVLFLFCLFFKNNVRMPALPNLQSAVLSRMIMIKKLDKSDKSPFRQKNIVSLQNDKKSTKIK